MPPLDALLSPASVAVVGASPEPDRIRGQLLALLRKNGFPGRIVPVNPSYTEIHGLPCYPTVAAAGGPMDVALVAIPAGRVLPALEECAAAGVRYAAVISSGFAEDGAAPEGLQDQVAALARRTGMRVLGPNGEGFHNEAARVSATFSPAVDRDADDNPVAVRARLGIIAQSGGMGFALYNRGRALGLSFSTVVTTGNEADLTAADILAHMAADPDTAGVLLFLETVRDPAGFAAAAAATRAAGKFIVAIKAGRSAAGKAAAASHTASMAGWNAGYDALFRRHGIHAATELEEALTLAAALASNPSAAGGRVAVVTVSGGAGAWSADVLEDAGLTLPELSAKTQAEIRGFIPSYGSARNPVDLTAGGAQGGGTLRTMELLTRDPGVDQVVVVTTLANPARVAFDGPALQALLAERRKPVLFYSYTLPSPLSRQVLADAGAVICPSMPLLARAARALVPVPAPTVPSLRALPDAARAALSGPAGPVAEHAAKAALAACGVALAPFRLVARRGDLAAAAAALGFPLAVKVQSPALPHKTEAGGVRLGITDLPGLESAFYAVLAGARAHAPDAPVEGVLLERMAPPGIEVIVGAVRDPTFGPVVTVGAGGVMAELYADTARRLAPVDEAEAAEMLRSLRSAPLLDGWRGAPAADLPALARLVADVSAIAHAARATIAELELNPVIVHPAGQGCTVADALLVLSPEEVCPPMQALSFAAPPWTTPAAETLRGEVRDFLADELRGRTPQQRAASWSGHDREFSRKMGARGWLGMTWPRQYGGHERSALERYVVLEEVLAAGAPVGHHWVAERQSGPSILRHGTEAQRQSILPRIAAGELSFCIGMSEPDSGSDLAAARTRAQRVQGGWLVNGTKVWTSSAHFADYMILFCRTGAPSSGNGSDDRHAGSSQFLVDMAQARSAGMEVRPIRDMRGAHHFNEVAITDLLLPEDALLGQEDDGWKQVTAELAFERSGPDRFLSSFTLLTEAVRALGPDAPERAAAAIGRLTSHTMALRRLSRSVAGMLQDGQDPALQAALVKDLGNVLEQETVEVVRLLVDVEPSEAEGSTALSAVLAHLVMTAPSFSLRGGTREILRGMIARGLGLR